ncbi:hypothetical protein BGZ99_000452 [Dissophora globulifera]|uniref:Ion transport domain-containing protein n=1 Tax=Dissophora globulifera TaxID=979702 RepID=A0A9P6RTN6_9FUNG|nr:hypothetical protein BGZ99_000452 [Dissophora globulifera]
MNDEPVTQPSYIADDLPSDEVESVPAKTSGEIVNGDFPKGPTITENDAATIRFIADDTGSMQPIHIRPTASTSRVKHKLDVSKLQHGLYKIVLTVSLAHLDTSLLRPLRLGWKLTHRFSRSTVAPMSIINETSVTHFLEIPSAEIDEIKHKTVNSEDETTRLKVPSLIRIEVGLASIEVEIIADFISHKLDDPGINDNFLEIHSVELCPAGGGLYEDNDDGILLNALATQHIDVGHHDLAGDARKPASIIAAQVNSAGTHVVTLSYTLSQAFIDLWQLNNTVKSTSEVHRIPCASASFTLPITAGKKQPLFHISVSYDASKIAVIRLPDDGDEENSHLAKGQASSDIPGIQLFEHTAAFIPAFLQQQQNKHRQRRQRPPLSEKVTISPSSPSSTLVPSTALKLDSTLRQFSGYGRFHFFEPVDEIDADARDAKEVFIACDGNSVFVYSTVKSWSLLHSISLTTLPSLGDVEDSFDRATVRCGARVLIDSIEGPLCILITSSFILVLNLQTASEVAHLAEGASGGFLMAENAAISPSGSLIAVGSRTLSLHTADGKLKLQEFTLREYSYCALALGEFSYGAFSFLNSGCQLMAETSENDVLIREMINQTVISSKEKILMKASGRWLVAQICIRCAVKQKDGSPQTAMKEVVLTMDESSLTVRPLTTSVCEYEPRVGRYPTQESCGELCHAGKHSLPDWPRKCKTPWGIHYQLQDWSLHLPQGEVAFVVLTKEVDSALYQVISVPVSRGSRAFFLPCESQFVIYIGLDIQVWEILKDSQEPGCRLLLMINIGDLEYPTICSHGKIIYLYMDPYYVGSDWDGPGRWWECSEETLLRPENAWLSTSSIPTILAMHHRFDVEDYRKVLLEYVVRLINNCPDPAEERPNFFFEVLSECVNKGCNVFLKDLLTYRGPQPTWIPKAHYHNEYSNPIRFMIEKAKVVAKYLPFAGILIDYCIRIARQECNTLYLAPVLNALPELIKDHPDFALDVMRKMAFIPLHRDDIPLTIVHALVRPSPTIRQYLERIVSGSPRDLSLWDTEVAPSSFDAFAHAAVFQMQRLLPTRVNKLSQSSRDQFPYDIYVAPVDLLWQYQALADRESLRVKAESGVRAMSWWEPLLGIIVYMSKPKTFKHVQTHAFRQEFFDNPAISALLEYKWNTFASSYWLVRFIFQCLYYILVLTVTLLQVYSDRPENLKSAFIAIIAYSSVFLWLEFIQLMKGWRTYLTSMYNYVDVTVFTLPMAASITQLLQIADPGVSSSQTTYVFSFSILVIYLHLLFELRVIRGVCQFVTIIVGVFRKIRIFFIIFAVAIFAFAHAFLHLLWARTESSVNMQENQITYPRNFARALSATYFFMGGIYDPVSNKFTSDDVAFHIMMVLYFFFTVILMLNVLIALINVAFTKTDESWFLVWAQNRLHYIESAENMSFHIPGFRNTHNWFPREVYYIATRQQVQEYSDKYFKEDTKAAVTIASAVDHQQPLAMLSKKTTDIDHRLETMQQAFQESLSEMKDQSDRQQDTLLQLKDQSDKQQYTLLQLKEQMEAQHRTMMELLQA